MTEVAGRPILAALHMLLRESCSGATPSEARLPALLRRSREYQSTVSTTLAQQVLDSLYELLRGFQAADERAKGELLRAVLAKNPDDVYAGLLNVLMRMVFLLFAEDRTIVPTDPKSKQPTELYVRHYSVHGLFERLRADAEHYLDTMDQRYGAWAQLLALFRAVHDGCKHPQMQMDATVLAAYGWTDLPTACDFILDYEDEETAEESSGRKRKKPWRFRWPDEVRDEVLARLLKLNTERAKEEELADQTAAAQKPKMCALTRGLPYASPRR